MAKLTTRLERIRGAARENGMHWAVATAKPGEDPLAIIARSQLYEDYVLGGLAQQPAPPLTA